MKSGAKNSKNSRLVLTYSLINLDFLMIPIVIFFGAC